MLCFRSGMFVLFVVLLPCLAPAADDDPQAVFSSAKTLYTAGNYDSVIVSLKGFVRKNGKHPANEYLVPLLLEALARKSESEFSRKLCDIYVVRYPKSSFTPRVWYLDGLARARKEEFKAALGSFSTALEAGVVPLLDSAIMTDVRFICEKRLTADELAAMADKKALHARIAEIVTCLAVSRLYQAGQQVRADRLGADFLQRFPGSVPCPQAKEWAARPKPASRGTVSVGLLAPVTGADADLGRRVIQGAQIAVDRYNQSGQAKINLVIADTKSSMVETARRTRELIDEQHVPVIIGPVLSEETVVAAAMAANKDVALITPTATEDGIAGLGQNIFQVNVTLATLGRRLADYAMKNLNIREFAIVSPTSEYGRVLTESFSDQVSKNGGQIVASETFEEGANDFKAQFKNLRFTLAKRKWDRETAEAGYGARRSAKADTLFLQDSSLSIGGLFIPAEAEDVVMLAPQVFFYKIKAQLLGATGWHNTKTILDGKQYVNNALVVTSLEPDREDKSFADFRAQYMTRVNSEPDRVAALGFDAAELVCNAFRSEGGSASAKQIIKALQSVQQYRGVSGLISFGQSGGINTEAAIVKISDRAFLRVQ